MIRALIQDVDDTTVGGAEETIHLPTWRRLFPPNGIDGGIPGVRVGMRPLNVIQAVMRHEGITGNPLDFERRRREIVIQLVVDPSTPVELNDGAIQLLQNCQEARIPVIWMTSGALEYISALFQRFNLRDYVKYVITGGLTEEPKPHSSPFDLAFNLLRREIHGLKPWEMVMIGDSPRSDIEGARRVGMHTIGLELPPRTTAQMLLDAGADLVVSSLAEINPLPGGTFDQPLFTDGRVREGRIGLNEYAWIAGRGKER